MHHAKFSFQFIFTACIMWTFSFVQMIGVVVVTVIISNSIKQCPLGYFADIGEITESRSLESVISKDVDFNKMDEYQDDTMKHIKSKWKKKFDALNADMKRQKAESQQRAHQTVFELESSHIDPKHRMDLFLTDFEKSLRTSNPAYFDFLVTWSKSRGCTTSVTNGELSVHCPFKTEVQRLKSRDDIGDLYVQMPSYVANISAFEQGICSVQHAPFM
eukprot:174768_1